MMRPSGKFTPAAWTRTTASRGPGVRSGTSSTTSRSGGPNSLHKSAFIGRPYPVAARASLGLCDDPGALGRRQPRHHGREARGALPRQLGLDGGELVVDLLARRADEDRPAGLGVVHVLEERVVELHHALDLDDLLLGQ